MGLVLVLVLMACTPANPATKYIVTSSVATVAAGGNVTITAQLADAANKPVKTTGKVVTWSSTGAGGSFASPTSTTNANGVATVVFTASATAGITHTVTATDNTKLSGTSPNILTQVGAPSASTSALTATPTSLTAGGTATSTIVVQLKDANGNNLTASGGTVTLSTTAGTLSAVTDNNNGTYTATLTASTAVGTATISATLGGAPLSSTASVSFVAGPLHHFAVEAQAGGNIGNQAVNAPFSIKITAQDANNNTVTSFSGTVDITSGGALAAGGGTTAVFVNGVLASHSVAISNTGSFTITATRTGGTESGISNSFAVNLVNIAPSFTKGPDQTVLEDAGLQTVNPWATAISPGPPNEAGQILTFNITGNTNPSLFSAGPAVSSAGVLTYTPAPNANGSATITLVLKDDGGTAGGGQDTSVSQSFTITLTPVNDAPSFTKGADQTINEDAGAQTVNGWATAISAGPNESGQTLTFNVTGNTNPALFSAAPAISPAGVLSYTPAPNANGTATITLSLSDDGGTANGGVDASASQSFVITVNSVNDAPSFTKGANQTINEDAGAQTVNGWATAISAGPANELGQTVSFLVSNNNNALFSAQPAVSPTGVLTYTPAANQNGSATVTVQIKDNGGTANGGVDTSAAQTFTITVNAVNDPPVAQTKTASAQANMKISINAGLLTGVTDADSGVNGCSPTFTVASISTGTNGTVSNVNLGAGTFDFDPTPGFVGNATATYTVSDNGCPGTTTSAPATINITVSGPVIWFVNPNSATNGNGTLNSPFNNLASAAAVDAAGHRIFVYSGTTPPTSITLNTNEWLIGQGITGTSFDVLFGITPPAGTIARPSINGTRPVVQGNVAMASSDAVRGLNIQPASGTAGLTASGASSLIVGEVSVTTANAAAVDLSSSGGTISLTTVNANGGSRGILLNNTTGTFTVTGSGGTCTEANPSGCTGGAIQNMTGADDSSATPIGTGIVLNNAQGVSLTRMFIQDHSNYAVRGTSVNGFTLDSSVVRGANGTNVATPFNDGSLIFLGVTGVSSGMTGTSSITNSVISGGWQRNISIDNSVGILNLTVSNNTIKRTSDAAGDDGLLIEADTTANITVNISNNTFARHGGDHINLSLVNNAVMNATISGNTLQGNYTGAPEGNHPIGLGQGIFIFGANFGGSFTYNISNNTIIGNNQGGAINVNKGSGSGSFSGRIENNTIGISGLALSGSQQASGIVVGARGSGTHTTLVNNNTVQQYFEMGINIDGAEDAAVTLNATVTNNTIREPGSALNTLHGLQLNWGVLSTGNGSVACVDIRSNNGDTGGNEPGGGVDYRIRQRMLTTVRLPGYAGAAGDNAAVQNFIAAQNNGTETVLASNNMAGGATGFVGGAACPQP